MLDSQSCVQLQLGLILWCFKAYTVVHTAGWGSSTKQQWTVLVVTAMYSICSVVTVVYSICTVVTAVCSICTESLLYYNSLTDTSNKSAWLCVTKQCHLLGSRLCYFPLHISSNIVFYPKLQLLCLWLWHCTVCAAKRFMVTLYWRIATLHKKNCGNHTDFILALLWQWL